MRRYPFVPEEADAYMSASPPTLLKRTTCPHCWFTFPPEDVLWVSSHEDLRGDARLGADFPQRFLPTRFNLEGNALDARGFVCQALACPHCHLELPRALLEWEPTFVSIIGSPASGKSFFLGAMTWQLRRLLPQHLGLTFSDADPVANQGLNEYEESLFLNERPDELLPLASLIRKTEEVGGRLYDNVLFGNQTVSYPRPFLFALYPRHSASPAGGRILCLYDNAGESFQAGKDSTANPVTRHMSQARFLLFLYDPTQDPRFLQLLNGVRPGVAAGMTVRTSRQEMLLQEAAVRVRRALGLSMTAHHDRPLVVVVTKADEWADLLPSEGGEEPLQLTKGAAGVDTDLVERRSAQVRDLLMLTCPELVTTAEGFAREVVYVPVSALGCRPELLPGPQGKPVPALRPRDLKPSWVTIPLLYGFCRWMPGLVPRGKPSMAGKPALRLVPGPSTG